MTEPVVSHVTTSQYTARHVYCVTLTEVQRALRETLKRQPDFVIKDKNRQGHCDHPEDGLCLGAAGADITAEQLAEVNARLLARTGKTAEPVKATRPKPAPKEPAATVSDSSEPSKETAQPKRGLPQGLQDYLRRKREAKEATA